MGLVILGIDPSTVNTGYGLIKLEKDRIECMDYGVISSKEKSFTNRLYQMYLGIKQLCTKYKPHHLAVEKTFFGKNPDVAFKLGHVFAFCLVESEKQNIELFEYPSRFIKKSVTFSGNASKTFVRHFVINFFSLPHVKSLDTTDALAVALCHARESKKKQQKQFNESFL